MANGMLARAEKCDTMVANGTARVELLSEAFELLTRLNDDQITQLLKEVANDRVHHQR